MRLFLSQTNLIETSPIRNKRTGEIAETLTVEVKLWDGDTEIDDSDITLAHVGGGVYSNKWPILEDLIDETNYDLEMNILNGAEVVWHFKGPIKAILRKIMS